MNYLAHLHLAEPTPESRFGNLLGDFVKGLPWDDRYPTAVWKGIVEHRHVDVYTDAHPAWKRSRDLLPPELRRFAGIVVDIFYDYFLHRHWKTFGGSGSLDFFIKETHGQLLSLVHLAPPEAARAIRAMIDQQWLDEYRSLDGIERTLERVSRRSDVLEPVYAAGKHLAGNLATMEEHFLSFYPDLFGAMDEIRKRIEPDFVRASETRPG